MIKLSKILYEIKLFKQLNRKDIMKIWNDILRKSEYLNDEDFIKYLKEKKKLEYKYSDNGYISNVIENIEENKLNELYNDILNFKKLINF